MSVSGRPVTPLRCPICQNELDRVVIRDIGGVTADIVWQVHAGFCYDHGWFQAEIVKRPPREIFGVDRPFGPVRRLIVDGEETFAFTTVWGALSGNEQRQPADPLDPRFWRVSDRSSLAAVQPGAIRRKA